MLKIWLTWLQPSLGVLGVAMLLTSPLVSDAATKPAGTAPTKTPATKTSKPQSILTHAGTTIDRELQSSGVPTTPDLAVRQLAISTMANSGKPAPVAAVSAPKFSNNNSNALASFLSPTEGMQTLSASKPQFIKHSVAAATATRSIQAKSGVIVPGLLIGNSDVHLSSRFLPNGQTEKPSLTAKLIASPTLTSSMLASATVADPYPVVLPQQLQGLRALPSTANLPKQQFTPSANDATASIPAGLQRLLGNEPIRQPQLSVAPVAKAVSPKANSLLALSQLISPGTTTPTVVARGASLQLNTTQAYISSPKFDLPIAQISNSIVTRQLQATKPAATIFAIKPIQRNLSTAVTQRKKDYVALMNDRFLLPSPKPVWTAVSQSHNLGGLILGSKAQVSTSLVASLSMTNKNNSTSRGLGFFNPASVN